MSCHGQNTLDFRQMALIVPEREEKKWKNVTFDIIN